MHKDTVQTVDADLRQGEHIPKMHNNIGRKITLRVLVPLTVLKVQMMPAKRTMMRKENKKAARPSLKSLYLSSSKPGLFNAKK
jgi:hypothetical protein